jgi:glycosyltransferase involved in cell wall biosynthesis
LLFVGEDASVKVIVAIEHRFEGTPDGGIWTQTMFTPSYWQRYLEVFEAVQVVARVRPVSVASQGMQRVNTDHISFTALPYYVGPLQYLQKARAVQKIARSSFHLGDAVMLYSSSPICMALKTVLDKLAYPYGTYLIADPYDVFSPGAVRHPTRPFFRWWVPRKTRQLCRDATAAGYITDYSLQRRYPPSPKGFTTTFSMAELPAAAFAATPRCYSAEARPITLITVGAMDQLYKAQDVLIHAVALCVQQQLDLRLVLVGDGKHRGSLAAQAQTLGIGDRIEFRGQMTAGPEVRAELDKADLFMLASRQEGLPRAMQEAMARGLPCIGSTVGGIPELLPAEDLVPSDNIHALAEKIREVVTHPDRMTRMSIRNLEKARTYTEDNIRDRRQSLYRALRDQTEDWIQHHAPAKA